MSITSSNVAEMFRVKVKDFFWVSIFTLFLKAQKSCIYPNIQVLLKNEEKPVQVENSTPKGSCTSNLIKFQIFQIQILGFQYFKYYVTQF